MRVGRLGRALLLTTALGLGAAITSGCAATGRPQPSTTPGVATTPTPTSTSGPAAPVPPLAAGTDNGALAGTWVADDGDVVDFVPTGPGTYRGAVAFASHCAPDTGPIVVSSQGPGRFAGTGPLASNGTGWCNRETTSVAIQVRASRSSAHVSSSPGGVGQTWTRVTFAVSGELALPGPNDGDGAQSIPGSAPTCDPATLHRYELQGSLIASSFGLVGAPAAARLLGHFLDGKGTTIDFAGGSAVAAEVARTVAFKQEDQRIEAFVAARLAAGATSIELGEGSGVLDTVDFTDPSPPDLYLGFRSTQGLIVTGVGAVLGSDYVGELTYVIEDEYGFGLHDYLLGAGAEMRYLQTTCGAPSHPGGAHWFPDSITVTVPLRLPRNSDA